MALYKILIRNYKLLKYCRYITSDITKCSIQQKSKNDVILEEDVMDEFITKLIQKKSNKWDYEQKKVCIKIAKTEKPIVLNINLNNANVEEINLLFKTALDVENYKKVVALMCECIKCEKCPSLSILLQVLSILSQNGDKETIIKTQDLYERTQSNVVHVNTEFGHYLAEATWIKGNINKALNLFETVYYNNAFLRRRIRLMLKYLILDIVSNRSEAALITVIDFCEKLVANYRDFYPLACVWQSCFLSEWYTDQCIAMQLLERNKGLCKEILNRIPYVITIALRVHQTDSVYRLLEVLLKYDMKTQYSYVLTTLFNYRFHERDLQSCSEIIKWSINNDVVLPSILHEKFLKLLLKFKIQTPVNKDNYEKKRPNVTFKF